MERALCPVLIGRESELTALEDALLAAKRGDGRIVLLAGEAGLGKTRLATELQRRALKIGMTVLWGGCSEADLALPYLPFLEAIGNHLATSDLEKIRQRLGPARRELAHLFPQIEPDAGVSEQGDPTQAKLRLFEAILALLRIPAENDGVLIILEDLHWSDASTRELLDYMTRRLTGLRAMVLGTYRTDELHRKHPLAPMVQSWRRTRAAEVIELEPLPPDGIAGMVGAIFDSKEITPEFRDFLHGRSEGNPFVLEELLKAALDRGDIYRGPERWERKALQELRLPQTVKDTILLRVERLSAEQAEILQTAAVLGPSFAYQALVAVSGRDEPTVQAALHASIQQQLMEEEPNATGRYRFRHALTREAIYEDMIAPRREQLHGRAADMLEDQPGSAPIDIAFHLFAAGRWGDAIPVGIKAAEDAERNAAYREAATLYERMLAHVRDELTRGQLVCRLGDAHFRLSDPGRAQRYLEEGIPLLEGLDQRREAARYRLVLGRCYWERSRPDAARAEYERARAELEPFGPSEDLANAYIRLAGLHFFELEDVEARDMARRAIDVAEAAHAEPARIWAGVFLGGALVSLGQPDEGFAIMDASYRDASARSLHLIAANALHNALILRCLALRAKDAFRQLPLYESLRIGGQPNRLENYDHGEVWWCFGYPAKARRFYETAIALARQQEAWTFEAWFHRSLALSVSALGRTHDAIAVLPSRESQRELQDLHRYTAYLIRLLIDDGELERAAAESLAVIGQPKLASAEQDKGLCDVVVEALTSGGRLLEAAQMVAIAGKRADPTQVPYQDRMEGRLALANNDIDAARRSLNAAVAAFEEAGYGLEEMRTRRALARVELAAGKNEAAEAQLRKIVELADEREAIFEGDRAREMLAELGIEIARAGPLQTDEIVEVSERLVTVLFIDIRGYSGMSQKQAPDALVDSVASLYRWARQEVERHYGLVDQYEGDAVMATFNVTGSRLDHCVQALDAAIAIRDKATAAGLPIGAAIAVGPAVVGRLSTDSKVSTYGEVANLASRLQGKAAAGEILLAEEAHRRVREWLRERGLAAVQEQLELKGYDAAVNAYRLAPSVALMTPLD
jgi:class 3 adenylate cyclase/tetratricopeptide (TPR) repeat protein